MNNSGGWHIQLHTIYFHKAQSHLAPQKLGTSELGIKRLQKLAEFARKFEIHVQIEIFQSI